MRWDHLPFGPLVRFAGAVLGDDRWQGDLSPSGAVAMRCNVTRRTADRWVQEGLSLDVAERACDALGVTPWCVWGEQYRWVQPEPEPEPHGFFGGRPEWYRCTGRADFYGDPDVACVQLRQWMAA